ncbi:hypothetical protein, partial [Roseibium sp. RKSG952]|uniref:hypothetical protein n=1 Tax=Roseibium sp. RKSG952 TaxID=2529384 RepID=UPI0018AD22A1
IVGEGSDTDASDGVINASAEDVFAETYALDDGTLAGVLADNGGPVQTILLKADTDNPALDIGDVPDVDLDGDGIV